MQKPDKSKKNRKLKEKKCEKSQKPKENKDNKGVNLFFHYIIHFILVSAPAKPVISYTFYLYTF